MVDRFFLPKKRWPGSRSYMSFSSKRHSCEYSCCKRKKPFLLVYRCHRIGQMTTWSIRSCAYPRHEVTSGAGYSSALAVRGKVALVSAPIWAWFLVQTSSARAVAGILLVSSYIVGRHVGNRGWLATKKKAIQTRHRNRYPALVIRYSSPFARFPARAIHTSLRYQLNAIIF